MFRPQSALLTLYGDYALQPRGEIGIGSVVKLLNNLGLSEQAIRSAVSRMCRARLLKARRVGRRSYYSLTEDGHSLLTKGAQRIFQRKNTHWDGTWNVVTYSIPEQRRQARDRLRLELGWMGYGTLSEATWISPYDLAKEVEDLVERLGIKEHVQIFHAEHQGFTDPKKIVSRCWDLSTTHEKYANFLAKYRPKLRARLKRLPAPYHPLPPQFAGLSKAEPPLSQNAAITEAKRCLRCDLRLLFSKPIWAPKEELWVEFTAENVSQVQEVEGVYQLLDEEKNVIYIKGAMNLHRELEEQLEVQEKARYFMYEEEPMYTKRESELLQQYIAQHGQMPEGNRELEDLF